MTARETFVTLISIISFISFKFGENFNINKSKLSLIIALLVGYLIPFVANIIYYITGLFGKTQYFCFIKKKTWVTIHLVYISALVIISTILITYLVVKTSCCKKTQEYDGWINDDDNEKYCMNPKLKKIIFFPIAQIFTIFLLLIFRFVDHYIEGEEDFKYSKNLARPAGVLNSSSSILYTLIFAITNRIFTNFNGDTDTTNSLIIIEAGTINL